MIGSVEAAYAALGLRPGADRDTVERAYRRLIKQHHPDHVGGDGERASEINRAYSLIRKAPTFPPPIAIPARGIHRRRRSVLSPLITLPLLIGVVLVARHFASAPEPAWPGWGLSAAEAEGPIRVERRPGLGEPLSDARIDIAVADAVRLHETADSKEMAKASAECLRDLRSSPNAAQFDSCAAFDEAASILQTGRAGFQKGPFNGSAVSARQVGAGLTLSSDVFAVDSRLQQIRSRVQMTLFPRVPDPPPADLNQL